MTMNKHELSKLIEQAILEEHTTTNTAEHINSALAWLESTEISNETIKQRMNKIIREAKGHLEILEHVKSISSTESKDVF